MKTERAHLRAVVNQDGAAILNSRTGTITTFNATGALVWQALERGEDLNTIGQELARETGEEIDVLKKDLLEFIDAMKKNDLLAS